MSITKDQIGIGILSFAHGHANVYCQVMSDQANFPDVKLVSAWDDKPSRGQANAQRYGIPLRATPAEVINDPQVDAVIVTCETNRHAGLIEQAAAAGKHILVPEAAGNHPGRLRPHHRRRSTQRRQI